MSFKVQIYLGADVIAEGEGPTLLTAERAAVEKSVYTQEELQQLRAHFECEETA